jgi:hypothetical protein
MSNVDTAARTALSDRIGVGYAALRQEDPRWRAAILEALGDASPVTSGGR